MTSSVKPQFREIPVALIDEPEQAARTRMDPEKLEELVAAIRRQGFTSVIGVAVMGERYEVIYGHRRRIAAARAGVVALPCLVWPSRDAYSESLKYGENAFREDQRPTEEAIQFNRMLEQDCGGDTDRLAALVGRKRDYVERRLLLLSGHEDVFNALDQKAISVGVAEQLNKCPDVVHVRYMLDQAVTCEWTVAQAAQAVHEWKTVHQFVGGLPAGAAGDTVAGPPMVDAYFTCCVCQLTQHPEEMRPIQVHRYCRQAVLDPALEFFQRRSDYMKRPRTDREALALLSELLELFPSLGSESAPAADPAAHS